MELTTTTTNPALSQSPSGNCSATTTTCSAIDLVDGWDSSYPIAYLSAGKVHLLGAELNVRA